jgi:hypothetical protein
MNKGEKCRLTLKGRFGYGAQPPPEFGLAPYESIVFTLFLKDFDKVPTVSASFIPPKLFRFFSGESQLGAAGRGEVGAGPKIQGARHQVLQSGKIPAGAG